MRLEFIPMAGNHTGPRILRLSSDNSPGVLVFTLSQVVANELLSSESINLIISSNNVPTEIRNFQGAVIKTLSGVQTQI
jgi:hypothetical protein